MRYICPLTKIWDRDTEGVVLDPDDVEDDEDNLPKYAKDHGLTYALSIQDIKGIVENAREQKKEPSDNPALCPRQAAASRLRRKAPGVYFAGCNGPPAASAGDCRRAFTV